MTVDAIKEAISQLPDDERYALAAWLNDVDYDEWDKQMLADFSPDGRGIDLVEAVKREIAEGKAVPYEVGLEQVRAERNRREQ